jgi:type I restriction enzyme S subunit
LEKQEKLKKLEEILRKGFQYPDVRLSEILECYENKITIEEDKKYKQITISNTGDVKLREIKLGSEIGTKKQVLIDLSQGDLLIYSRLGLHTGAIGLIPQDLDSAVVTVDMPVFRYKTLEVSPKYVALIVQNKKFIDKVVEQNPTGAAQTRFHEDKFLQLQIPLPPLEVQNEIVKKIEKQKQIIEGAERIEDGFSVDQFIDTGYDEEFIEKLAEVDGSPVKDLSSLISETYVGGENIESGSGRLLNLQTVQEAGIIGPSYKFRKGHVVYSKVRPNLKKCFFADFDGVCSSDIYPLKINEELVLPKYFALILQSKMFAKKTESFQDGRSGMPKINQDQLAQIKIPLPPLETQRQIVEKLDKQMRALKGVRLLKSEAEKRIEEILAGVWGE